MRIKVAKKYKTGDNLDTLGKRILYLRKKFKLTQKELAAVTGLQRGNLSHYEKDKIKPAAEAIIALAKHFSVSTDWLLMGKEKTEADPLCYALSEQERMDVEQYVQFVLWKRDRAKQAPMYAAEEMEKFDTD